MRRLLPIGVLALGAMAWGGPVVEVQGLFPGMVVLMIDGARRTLRAGETSPEGVTLIAADSERARLRVDGETRVLALSDRAGAAFNAPARQTVRVPQDASGHYRVAGAINGHAVTLMVDTGASMLAMSGHHAEALGIDFVRTGEAGRVTTAAGVARAYGVQLDRVAVGGITLRSVRAAVIEGDFPREILLGMSFLRRVGFSENDGVLTIREKY